MTNIIPVQVESLSIEEFEHWILFKINDKTIGKVSNKTPEYVWDSGFFDSQGNQIFLVCNGELRRIYGKNDELFIDVVTHDKFEKLVKQFADNTDRILSMQERLSGMMNEDYESFVKALIKIELETKYEGEVNEERLDNIYRRYMKADEPLLNELVLSDLPELNIF